jgi:hemerythrin-like domain-containing protein
MTDDSPKHFFETDHHNCDDLWVKVESAVDSDDAPAARRAFKTFYDAMMRHFDMEEEVLFPALESATGMQGFGPTMVMRSEHEQMRGVLRQMANAAELGNYVDVVDHGDTLLMLIQQHNVKEEAIVYPMADQHLQYQWGEIFTKLGRYKL